MHGNGHPWREDPTRSATIVLQATNASFPTTNASKLLLVESTPVPLRYREAHSSSMLRPNRRPSHSNEDLNGSASSLDLNYGNAGPSPAVPSYGYGGGGSHPSTSYGAGLGRKPAADNYSIYKDKPSRRGSGVLDGVLAILKQPVTWAMLLLAGSLWNTISNRSQVNALLKHFNAKSLKQAREAYSKLQHQKTQLERENARIKTLEHQSTKKNLDLDKNMKTLQRERDDLKRKLQATEAKLQAPPVPLQQQVATLTSAKEQAYKELVKSLQASVQRESRRAVLEKFGAPPYRVEMTVKLPSNLNQPLKFTIQLAPLEHMPHSVHLFLEQVAHGLWNGNAFLYVNGPHVIQCGPQASHKEGEVVGSADEERQKALAPFKKLQLDSLTFPEYSDHFPHLPWTLGFTGRPGGPDWYINKRNNTLEHGPGGIGSRHELSSEYGDPCFAQVVDGFDVVQRMFAEKTILSGDPSTKYFFEEPIQLVKAEIIGWNPQLTAEAASMATNATIQGATGESIVGETTTSRTVAGVANLTEAAAKIAAKLAEVGELQKQIDSLNAGPWTVSNVDGNREKQDITLGEEGVAPKIDRKEATKATQSNEKPNAASQQSSMSDAELPGQGLPEPPSKQATTVDGIPPVSVTGGNIDPEYTDELKSDEAMVPSAAGGSAGIVKKKKELMMARS